MNGEGANALAESRCALHPEVQASITCSRCGNFSCTQCIANPSAVAPICNDCAARGGQTRYYAVPPARVVTLYVLTFGMYGIWWFYQNWRAIKRHDGSSIWPIPRALFSQFSYFLLISDLNQRTRDRFAGSFFSELGTGPALGFFLLNVAYRLPDPFWIITLAAGVCLLPAARRIAELEGTQALEANRPLRTRHYVLGAVCVLVLWPMVIFEMIAAK
jgi:hypothetical protein